MPINTLYQLYAAKRDTPELLRAAHRLVTIPDLFNFWMSGTAVCEFTNASTTQMLDPVKRAWCDDLLEALGLPAHLPAPLVEPGSIIGELKSEPAHLAGTPVIAPACHDTGSAVASIAARDGTVFISSGTWSLVGTELDSPLISSASLRLNFTNEAGVCGTTRFLKNVMGLWMLQGCRHSWSVSGKTYEYSDLMDLAARSPAFAHVIDPDDESFLHPADMLQAIDQFCRKTQQASPKSAGAYARAVLEGLAFKYAVVIAEIEQLTGTRINQIRVIGGGARNRLLNQFTADAAGRTVIAGPVEATAIGNIAVQLLATGEVSSLSNVRALIESSFPTERFQPRETDVWAKHAQRFRQYCEATYA
jgi:rhamnulokinase